MVTEETIQAKIEQVTRAREEFIANANLQLAAFDGALQVLQQLLAENAAKE